MVGRGTKLSCQTTVGGGCVLGISLSEQSDSPSLQAAYGEFVRKRTPSFLPIACSRCVLMASKPRATRGASFSIPRHSGALLFARDPQTDRTLPGRFAAPSPGSGVACLSGSDQSPIRATAAALGRVGTDLPGGLAGTDGGEDGPAP